MIYLFLKVRFFINGATCGRYAPAVAPPKKKGPGPPPAAKTCERADVFISEQFGGWQEICLGILSDTYDAAFKTFPPMNELLVGLALYHVTLQSKHQMVTARSDDPSSV